MRAAALPVEEDNCTVYNGTTKYTTPAAHSTLGVYYRNVSGKTQTIDKVVISFVPKENVNPNFNNLYNIQTLLYDKPNPGETPSNEITIKLMDSEVIPASEDITEEQDPICELAVTPLGTPIETQSTSIYVLN